MNDQQLEAMRHENRMIELEKEEKNILLKFEKEKELLRMEMAEKKKLEQLKFDLRRQASRK